MAAAQPQLPKYLISGSYRWDASGSRCDVGGASEALETRLCLPGARWGSQPSQGTPALPEGFVFKVLRAREKWEY